jgi:predicted PurR-regulated permease PerM
MDTIQRQNSFLRIMLVLASTVIVLAGIRSAASLLNPILFALVFALIFSPVYAWLLRRGVAKGLAVLLMIVGIVIFFGLLFYFLAAAVTRLTTQLGFYATELESQTAELQNLLTRLNLPTFDPGLSTRALVNVSGRLLSAVAGFLSYSVLIMVTMLFFLIEGPAIMARLRAGVSPDNPQVSRLVLFGHGVIRAFGMRAIVNGITGAAFGLFLWLLGLDYGGSWSSS